MQSISFVQAFKKHLQKIIAGKILTRKAEPYKKTAGEDGKLP